MEPEEPAIQVEDLAFQISPRGVDSILRGQGIEVRLSSLNVRVSEAALNAILARLAPEGEPEALQAKITTAGLTIDRHEGQKSVHLDVALSELRVALADGELRLESVT
jgi:hypothetical protein